jgi:D-alanyl-D-alanine carboxypeptidase
MASTYVEFDMETMQYVERPIPEAPYYVVSMDRVLSNWDNTPSEGKANYTVTPCATRAEADRVQAYATSRSDTYFPRVVASPPINRPHIVYSLVTGWVATSLREGYR